MITEREAVILLAWLFGLVPGFLFGLGLGIYMVGIKLDAAYKESDELRAALKKCRERA